MNNRAYHLQALAHTAVRNALTTGEIVRQPCEQCGCPAQAHHDSYYPDKWLSVRWLCSKHHQQWHDENEPDWPTIFEFHPSDLSGVKLPGRLGRRPRPWYRNATKCWYVVVKGKRHNLGPDENEAMRRFRNIVSVEM